jgi:hypothetical protein
MRKKLWTWLAVAVLLSGCVAHPSKEATAVASTDASNVTQCTELGTVVGISEFAGGMYDTHGVPNARTAALEQAAQLQATHVVWKTQSLRWQCCGGTTVTAEAYRCGV